MVPSNPRIFGAVALVVAVAACNAFDGVREVGGEAEGGVLGTNAIPAVDAAVAPPEGNDGESAPADDAGLDGGTAEASVRDGAACSSPTGLIVALTIINGGPTGVDVFLVDKDCLERRNRSISARSNVQLSARAGEVFRLRDPATAALLFEYTVPSLAVAIARYTP